MRYVLVFLFLFFVEIAVSQESILLGQNSYSNTIDTRKIIYDLEVLGIPLNTSSNQPKIVSGNAKELFLDDITIRNRKNIPLPSNLNLNILKLTYGDNKEIVSNKKRTQNEHYQFSLPLQSGLNEFLIQCSLEDLVLFERRICILKNKIPNLFILSIGIPYQNITGIPDLTITVNDAKQISSIIQRTQAKVYNNIYSKTITSKDSTSSISLLQNIDYFINEAISQHHLSSDDVFIFFISSHGEKYSEVKDFYIPLSNFNGQNQSFLENTSLRFSFLIQDYLLPLSKQCKLINIIDACHSGSVNDLYMGSRDDGLEKEKNAIIQKQIIDQSPGSITITSSSGEELSYVHNDWKLSALTKGIVDLIYNKEADLNNDGYISYRELQIQLPQKVKFLVKSKYGEVDSYGRKISQTPDLKKETKINDDFPIFKISQ